MSEDQSMREAKDEMTAQPCSSGLGQWDEDAEDFSDSSSDWVPSDEETESCDSEGETKGKKKRSERCKRQHSRPDSKGISPSNIAVNDSMIMGIEMQVSRNDLNMEPDIIKRAQAVGDHFKRLLEMMADLKEDPGLRAVMLQSTVNGDSTEQTVPIAPNFTADNELQGSSSQPNRSLDESNRNNSDNVVFKKPYSKGFIIRNNTVGDKNVKEEWVPIGSGMTLIPRDKYNKINWKSYTIATRSLLVAVFSRRVLATHSLTGKPSPAFQDKPVKMSLDQRKTSDVIAEVMDRFKIPENLVRSIITTKCADECKMWKTRCERNASKTEEATDTVE